MHSTQLLVIRMITSKYHEQAYTALANQQIGKLAAMSRATLSLSWTGSADTLTEKKGGPGIGTPKPFS